MLLIIETHPVPYHAPVYRSLVQEFGIPLTVLYGSDFSVQGYMDREFNFSLHWDSNLMEGYDHRFLSRMAAGGGRNYDEVQTAGLTQTADAIRASVVMALGYYHRLDRAAIRYAYRRHLPLMFRGETSDQAQTRSPLRALARDVVLRQLYQRCQRLLYVGTQAREHYQRLNCPEQSLIFSPYCVDESNFRSGEEHREAARRQTREKLGIPEDALVLLFSGKLTPRKGVDLIPAAIRLLPADLQKKCVLVLLGEGTMRQELEASCVREPAVQVRFAGFQNQTNLSSYYHAADALVLPSRFSETWGVVVNEALLHGVPCVTSTAVGSHPDLVIPGVTGERCAPDNTVLLARAIETTLRRGNDLPMRDQCRHVVARFSTRTAAEGVARAYSEIMQGACTTGPVTRASVG